MSAGFPLRIGVAVPQHWGDPAESVAALRTFLDRAESGGLDSVWMQEQLLGSDPSFEPIAMLGFVAAATSRLRLGLSAVVAPLRNPVALAKQFATLDQVSLGRLDAGLVIGEMPAAFTASNVPWRERGARTEHAVAVLRGLWRGEPFDLDARFGRFDGAVMTPTPVQPGGPPLWMGGKKPASLARIARLADGWLGAGGSSIPEWAESHRYLAERLAAEGRDIRRSKKVYLWIDDDEDRARASLANWFAVHWGAIGQGAELAERVGVAGSAARVTDTLAGLVDLGADTLVLNPVGDELRQLDRIVMEIAPALRAA